MNRRSHNAAAGRGARLRRRILYALPVAVVLLAAGGLGWKAWRLYGSMRTVQSDLRSIELLAGAQPGIATLPALVPLLAQLRSDADALRAEAAPALPLARRLDWAPRYGPTLAAAEPLLDMLTTLAAAADDAGAALMPVAAEIGPGSLHAEAIAARLLAGQARLVTARAALDRAAELQPQIPTDALEPAIREPLRRALALLPQARDGLDLAIAAPGLLGASGARSYLLLAQNSDELRATGGFIGAAGVLTLDRGAVAEFSLRDSPEVDDLAHRAYPPPPEPLRRYMGLQLWLFRDANWSPDFPSAARQALASYQLGKQRGLDGAIAFDQAAVKLLLGALGPVRVEGVDEAVSAENVARYMREQYNLNFRTDRKSFMETLGRAIVRRFASGVDARGLAALGGALRQALDERHILLYVDQPEAAGLLARRGWDGAVRPGAHDFLMVVDSNVGYNKVFPSIAETISYTVDLSDPRAPIASLTVRHANRQPRAHGCSWRQREKITRYEDYFVGCYWDYLRALVPADSRLVAAQTQPIPGDWLFESTSEDGDAKLEPGAGGSFSLETLVVVPMDEERATTFRYRLPAGVVVREAGGWRYSLAIQKQPGTAALPVGVRVQLPQHARLASLAPQLQQGDSVVYTLRLDRDQRIELAFTTP